MSDKIFIKIINLSLVFILLSCIFFPNHTLASVYGAGNYNSCAFGKDCNVSSDGSSAQNNVSSDESSAQNKVDQQPSSDNAQNNISPDGSIIPIVSNSLGSPQENVTTSRSNYNNLIFGIISIIIALCILCYLRIYNSKTKL